MASIKSIPVSVTFLCLCVATIAQYGGGSVQPNYGASSVPQPVASVPQGTRVIEDKDYNALENGAGWSPWLLCMPLIFIPLILLLCTPLFHNPVYGGGSYGGYYGGHGTQGWKRSSTGEEALVTTSRVLKSISKKA